MGRGRSSESKPRTTPSPAIVALNGWPVSWRTPASTQRAMAATSVYTSGYAASLPQLVGPQLTMPICMSLDPSGTPPSRIMGPPESPAQKPLVMLG